MGRERLPQHNPARLEVQPRSRRVLQCTWYDPPIHLNGAGFVTQKDWFPVSDCYLQTITEAGASNQMAGIGAYLFADMGDVDINSAL